MANIAIIYMGGTFGCIGAPLYPMPAEQFLLKLQQLPINTNLSYFAAPTIKDSSELDASDWLSLAKLIHSLRPHFNKFVLIHGTDTLSYAAAILHHLFQQDISLLITGSQQPLLDPLGTFVNLDSDAWHNFNYAAQQISQIKSGVHICFDQKVFTAQSAYKQHTSKNDAFLFNDDRSKTFISKFPLSDQHIQNAKNIRIFNYYLTPNASQNIIKNLQPLISHQPHILILQCFGSGNIPYSEELSDLLKDLIEQNCWVIVSSQVLFGKLSDCYATGSWLSQLGVVFDPHFSQADLYARAMLLFLQYGDDKHWQKYWKEEFISCKDTP